MGLQVVGVNGRATYSMYLESTLIRTQKVVMRDRDIDQAPFPDLLPYPHSRIPRTRADRRLPRLRRVLNH